ncbi:MAG: hypothetical protein HGB05_11130 [Chloroflexi bacterium]|nr:hypothetical protein [Chloroflexota bacterium]
MQEPDQILARLEGADMKEVAPGQAKAGTDGRQSSRIGDGRQTLITARIYDDDLVGRNLIMADEVVASGL